MIIMILVIQRKGTGALFIIKMSVFSLFCGFSDAGTAIAILFFLSVRVVSTQSWKKILR